jgi:hypothetical protein
MADKTQCQTTDGWLIETVDQEGAYAGEAVGRVWLKSPTLRTNAWQWYACGSVAQATAAAHQAQTMTQAAFAAWVAHAGTRGHAGESRPRWVASKTWENGSREDAQFADYTAMLQWFALTPEAGIAAYDTRQECWCDQRALQEDVQSFI